MEKVEGLPHRPHSLRGNIVRNGMIWILGNSGLLSRTETREDIKGFIQKILGTHNRGEVGKMRGPEGW